jgi:hypothetical protein
MKRLLTYFSIIIFLFSSCRAHLRTEANNQQQGYADSQVVGVWKITAATSDVPSDWNGDGSMETDIYNTWSACQKDNLYSFLADKTGTFKLTCSGTYNGTWTIVNTQYLEYTPVTLNLESEKMVAMTNLEFKSERAVTLSSGQPATITKTWTRQ